MDISNFHNSMFLTALGNAILNSLWQSFLLWVLFETLVISYKNTNSKFKHNLSVLFLFVSFIWFIFTFILKLQASEKIISFISGTNNIEITDKGKSSFFSFFSSLAGNIIPYLSIAYILLVFFLTARLFAAYRHVHFISNKNLIAPTSDLKAFAYRVASQLGISKKIKIWISNYIEVPATIGFIKPVILIPFASINHLTADQLEAIILHELSHIKRNDYLVNLLVSIVETILFFNPFIAIFIKIIQRERENCCDDFVLQYRYDPHSYASALLKLEQSRKNNVQLALGAVSGKKQLLSRIKRITGNNKTTHFNYGHKLAALLITTAIFSSIAWLSPSKIKNERTYLPQKNNFLVSQVFAAEILPKSPIENINLKSKRRALKIKKLPEINLSGNFEVPGAIANDPDTEFFQKLPFITQNTLKTFQNNFNRNIPQIDIEKKDVSDEINNGMVQAFDEISKVNWTKVQSDIKRSFTQINLDKLTGMQRLAILKAKKYISQINLNSQKINSQAILNEIKEQKKLMADSLTAAATALANQLPARIAECNNGNEILKLVNSANHFEFSYNGKFPGRIFKRNPHQAANEPTAGFKDNSFRINIQTVPSNNENFPPVSKKVKKSQHIVEI